MKEAGANSVRACASHCVMSGPASERVQNSALEEIVFTDSIPYSLRCAKVKQLSVADMFAETIRRLLNNESISDQYIVRNLKQNNNAEAKVFSSRHLFISVCKNRMQL